MERKSSAKESLPHAVEPSFVNIEAELGVQQPIKGHPCGPPGHGRNIRTILETITPLLT
jgi:hypothetical protein